MPKLIVELKQNTPMIHFQAEESGATLRATAVKPALDKFLISRLGLEKTKPWMHDTIDRALDYRMTFQTNPNEKDKCKENDELKKGKPYFGTSKGVLNKEPITMTIISEQEGVINAIKESIKDFFILNNFGVRGTKGYGSFQVYSIDGEKPVSYSDYDVLKAVNSMPEKYEASVYKLNCRLNYNDWKRALEEINKTYSQMKSGKATSSLLSYGKKQGLSGEKQWIKQNFTGEKARFLRAMLGLTGAYKFRYSRTISVKDSTESSIERFASPIIFKPLKHGGNLCIYILLRKIPSGMFGHKFTFSDKNNGYKHYLSTPKEEEFSLIDFMKYYVEEEKEGLIERLNVVR